MFGEIQPQDVYEKVEVLVRVVNRLAWAVLGLYFLVMVQIAAKFFILGKANSLLHRAERKLRLSELEGIISNRNKERLTEVVRTKTEELKQTVEQVPKKTVEEIHKNDRDRDSHHELPGLP